MDAKDKDTKSELPDRKHLTPTEVERLIRAAAKVGRYGQRDSAMILIAFRHGLRVSELCGLRWSQVHFPESELYVARRKRGKPGTHPIAGDEMRVLRKMRRDHPDSAYVFNTERGGPMEESGFAKIVKRAGKLAGIEMDCHPHVLRHACGYALADRGRDTRLIQDYLGHQNIRHTVNYTKLSGRRFRGLWDD